MIYLSVIVLLFLFAIFDLHVGVSNDAVNFLNSAIGSKTAKFKVVLLIAAVGVFCGAVMSNGMMDVARHGVFHPQYFTYDELICIMLGMMTTDVVLLDIFNTLGLPTSTTISLVFELLGGSVAIAIYKTASDGALHFSDLLNTGNALTMIMAIFVSVAIAFAAGIFVQFICRLVFSFNYLKRLRYFVGLFGGLAITAIVYFMLIKNIKGSSIMTASASQWIGDNSARIMWLCFIGSTLLMQLFYFLRINVFKIVVLAGTFALAMAFASNDLVNFIGVPLAGFSAYQDFMANAHGAGGDTYLMGALSSSAVTPVFFLVAAGAVMIYSLMTSKKAQNVVRTSVDLARQDEGDEMFGTSSLARSLVRASVATTSAVRSIIPDRTLAWVNRQFRKEEAIMPRGASFDLVRASVNLVISALLIAWGTSYKLPLSTTYVTFMVAMGSSLSDRAWGRESAVFRVTGVISVIGGWFLTAGAAFVAAFCVTSVMYFGGFPAMLVIALIAMVALIRSNIRYKKKEREQTSSRDELFHQYMTSTDPNQTWQLLSQHVAQTVGTELSNVGLMYQQMTEAFERESLHEERQVYASIDDMKDRIKKTRRKELVGLRKFSSPQAILRGTYFHLLYNSVIEMLYGMKRLGEVLREHLEKNYLPLPPTFREEFVPIRDQWMELLDATNEFLSKKKFDNYYTQLNHIDEFRAQMTEKIHEHIKRLQTVDRNEKLNIYIVYLSLLQETQAEAAMLKQVVRNYVKFESPE